MARPLGSKDSYKRDTRPYLGINRGIKRGPMSLVHRKKISSALKGCHQPQHVIELLKQRTGDKNPMWGRKLSKNHIEAIRRSVTGNQNINWKGGIAKIDRLCRTMREYYEWRTEIFQRDNFTCKDCNRHGGYLTVHHIKSFSLILKENKIATRQEARECDELWDLDNGIVLCEECHRKTDNYAGRGIQKKLIIKTK